MNVVSKFDPWGSPLCTCPSKYSLQPYTGCSHRCLYCYATSYIGYKPSRPKKDLIQRLLKELPRLDKSKPINMSTSSDPYPPEEAELKLTRRVLEILCSRGFKVLITTKSDLVVRDVDILKKCNAAVMITITTLDEHLAKVLEPGAPPPHRRLRAIDILTANNVPVGVRIDPIIPFINDDMSMIKELISVVKQKGALTVTTSTYKAKPDNFRRIISKFPELHRKLYSLYFECGDRIGSYLYLPAGIRQAIIQKVREEALKAGLAFASCREGLSTLNTAPSCDGSHLIKVKVSIDNLL